MEKPVLSPDFTIEDIRKLREYNYNVTRSMTSDQIIEYYNSAAMKFEREMERIRQRNRAKGSMTHEESAHA